MWRLGPWLIGALLVGACTAAAPPASTPSPAAGSRSPLVTPAPSPSPSPTSADPATATALATSYEVALRASDWATAWALLAPGPLRPETYEAFVGFNESPGPDASAYLRYVVTPATRDPAVLSAWLYASLAADLERQADPSRAYVVIVEHPDVVGASASTEVLVAAPLKDGSWRLWRAH